MMTSLAESPFIPLHHIVNGDGLLRHSPPGNPTGKRIPYNIPAEVACLAINRQMCIMGDLLGMGCMAVTAVPPLLLIMFECCRLRVTGEAGDPGMRRAPVCVKIQNRRPHLFRCYAPSVTGEAEMRYLIGILARPMA